jgi:hypothetical protein
MRVEVLAEERTDVLIARDAQRREEGGGGGGDGEVTGRGRGWRGTYVDPGLFLHLESVVLDFGAIDGDSLTRRSQIIGAADGRPLPVLHLDERGWTRRVRGGRCNRHQKACALSALLQRRGGSEQGEHSRGAVEPRLDRFQVVSAVIKRR